LHKSSVRFYIGNCIVRQNLFDWFLVDNIDVLMRGFSTLDWEETLTVENANSDNILLLIVFMVLIIPVVSCFGLVIFFPVKHQFFYIFDSDSSYVDTKDRILTKKYDRHSTSLHSSINLKKYIIMNFSIN
jgi:type IV secretory pathway component VirB8